MLKSYDSPRGVYLFFLIVLGVILSIIFMAYVLNRETKNNNTKLIMGIMLILSGIVIYIMRDPWITEILQIIITPHYAVIVIIASFYILIGIIGIAKAIIHNE